MVGDARSFDPDHISPEEFAALIAGANDQQIEEGIRTVGTERSLERNFHGFPERFRADQAKGVDADVQWVVTDEGEEHPFVIAIHDGSCTARSGRADAPKVTMTVGLVPFAKLVTGQANGMQMFMTGRLKVTGDLMFAPRIMGFFDP